jgi:hypothetical protein
MPYERYEIGWQGLADMLRMSIGSAIAHKEEFQEHGIIVYRWIGKPRRKRVLWKPSIVDRFVAHKGQMKELL